jgi:hypothetical protein
MNQRLSSYFRYLAQCAASSIMIDLLACMFTDSAQADTFSRVIYDNRKDELVITMRYRGTNPDHTFSLRWGPCKETADSPLREVVAEVLDNQWQDEERADFEKTTRFSLTDLPCRPAALTLRTAPRLFYTLLIPSADVPPR